MLVDVIVPKLDGYEVATVVRWLKAEGETVTKDEALLEVAVPKVTVQVQAPASGKVVKILVSEGKTARIEETVGVIELSEG